jgi:hypothetical protein
VGFCVGIGHIMLYCLPHMRHRDGRLPARLPV